MSVREIRLPEDLQPLGEMLVKTFQYPENPEWGVQDDEADEVRHQIRLLRRLWFLVRGIQLLSKPMRDMVRGFVWEEEGQLGAGVLYNRIGVTDRWSIGTVGVLPEFRRRGLARELVQRALEDIRRRGGTHTSLAVIDKNVPAYSLYTHLGFSQYNSVIEYTRSSPEMPDARGLPEGMVELKWKKSDWRPRYELARRITPEEIQALSPIEEGQFRVPVPARILDPLLDAFRRSRQGRAQISCQGVVVGQMAYDTPGSGKGVSSIQARLDPGHPEAAEYMLAKMLRAVLSINPVLRVQFSVPSWMHPLVNAAETLGFTRRLTYHMLVLPLR